MDSEKTLHYSAAKDQSRERLKKAKLANALKSNLKRRRELKQQRSNED